MCEQRCTGCKHYLGDGDRAVRLSVGEFDGAGFVSSTDADWHFDCWKGNKDKGEVKE